MSLEFKAPFPKPNLIYYLSPEDFQLVPNLGEVFKLSNRIERSNLMPFIITCYSISRGSPLSLVTPMAWKKMTEGFDYQTTLGNYAAAGGYRVFCSEELDMFETAFDRLEVHQSPRIIGGMRGMSKSDFIFGVLDRQMREIAEGVWWPSISESALQYMDEGEMRRAITRDRSAGR